MYRDQYGKRIGYGMNLRIGNWNTSYHKLSEVSKPSETVVMSDIVSPDLGYDWNTFKARFPDRHGGGGNILWVDGHVSFCKKEDVNINWLYLSK